MLIRLVEAAVVLFLMVALGGFIISMGVGLIASIVGLVGGLLMMPFREYGAWKARRRLRASK